MNTSMFGELSTGLTDRQTSEDSVATPAKFIEVLVIPPDTFASAAGPLTLESSVRCSSYREENAESVAEDSLAKGVVRVKLSLPSDETRAVLCEAGSCAFQEVLASLQLQSPPKNFMQSPMGEDTREELPCACFQYLDDEDDIITVRNDRDFDDALRHHLRKHSVSTASGSAAPSLRMTVCMGERPMTTPTLTSAHTSPSPHSGRTLLVTVSVANDGQSQGNAEERLEEEQMVWRRGELLGEGSFGKVYSGLDLRTGRFIAVKCVRTGTSDESKERRRASRERVKALQQEIDVLKGIQHPGIVKYLGTQRTRNKLYIMMEYASEGSLLHALRKFGALSEAIIRLYCRQILDGLAYLHKNHIMHRDIKPSNILIDKNTAGVGVVKLADFGCSTRLSVPETGPDETVTAEKFNVIGTTQYMAPEVMDPIGGPRGGYGFRADVWSFGMTVVEMASGRCPFRSPQAAVCRILRERVLPELPEHLSETARTFVGRCLMFNPQERASAAELLVHAFCDLAQKPTDDSSFLRTGRRTLSRPSLAPQDLDGMRSSPASASPSVSDEPSPAVNTNNTWTQNTLWDHSPRSPRCTLGMARQTSDDSPLHGLAPAQKDTHEPSEASSKSWVHRAVMDQQDVLANALKGKTHASAYFVDEASDGTETATIVDAGTIMVDQRPAWSHSDSCPRIGASLMPDLVQSKLTEKKHSDPTMIRKSLDKVQERRMQRVESVYDLLFNQTLQESTH